MTPEQQERLAFVNQYNRGTSSKSRRRQNVPAGTTVGMLYTQLNLLTEQEKQLSESERDNIIIPKLLNIETQMVNNLSWLDQAKFFAFAYVPANIPGEEFEESFIGREWHWVMDMFFTNENTRFHTSHTKTVPANEVVTLAAVRLTRTFHGSDHSTLMSNLIANYNVVLDIDLLGQLILPDEQFKLRGEARLRCDGVQAEIPEPPPVEEP